ncbi:PF20097 family protein [Cellulosilyticum sp. I15G10I2]|uniref:PF20097 family protein n=1 Tax=Cellulosilyticum sp. I15G10I2 TaxID=1892843 RepID=UPI00085C578B|nr:PF20097 family protein [Cellulosilyticum sp. I15G10I2]
MNCPMCGNEMKFGKIGARAGAGLFWLPDEEKVKFIVSNNIIEKHNGIVLVDCNEWQISHTAYVCEGCRKVIIDY